MNGEKLRKVRDDLQLTQAQLAEKLGVSANTVARWERDEMAIPPYLELALKQIESET